VTETESRPHNRALVASFLFTDLVGYSKGSAAEQYAEKAALSEVVRRTLASLRAEDYRIKDTGDGALIAFLSSPEHALYAALAITDEFVRAAAAAKFPSATLRTGLHIGAVKEALDLEARPNFVGDGINAAKRIMDFAAPGQIIASRSYFEAVSWLDNAYAAMFAHLGASDDKHGRAHELYAIVPDAAVFEKLKAELGGDGNAGALDAPIAEKAQSSTGSSPATPAPVGRSKRILLVVSVAIAVIGALAMFLFAPETPNRLTAKPAITAPPSHGTVGAPGPAAASDVAAPTLPSPQSARPATPSPAPSTPPAPRADPPVDAQNADRSPAAPAPRAPVVPSPGTPSNSETRRKLADTPPNAASANATGTQASARCRRILEKAAVGEPLSQHENRELAISCR
jgi:class 3 adenylate cyclase